MLEYRFERRHRCRTCGSDNLKIREAEALGYTMTCGHGHWSAVSFEDPMSSWVLGKDGYEMHLKRVQFSRIATVGELWLGDRMDCYTLEDTVRPVKIPKVTAIPAGRYEVIVDQSNRFKRLMPHILDVPDFEGVRIHSGNTAEDTEGCILVGRTRGDTFVGESHLAFELLFAELKRALSKSRVWIRVTNEEPIAAYDHLAPTSQT